MKRSGRVAVVGAGFGGSLIATIAARLGHSVLLVERGRLPRHAVGESSTPLADLILAELCDRYDLPALRPLCSWGAWQEALPDVRCGLKRGFTYLSHRPGERLSDSPEHDRSLLVAASPDDASGDTHWLRHDVDLHFLKAALDAGVEYREGVEIRTPEELGGADLVIDASGRSQALSAALGAQDATGLLSTRTRASWAHFDGLPPWPDAPTTPYAAEAAAVHHLLDGGAWVWALRFDQGVVSLGGVFDEAREGEGGSGGEGRPRSWAQEIARFPSLATWLAEGRQITERVTTGRLQRLVSPSAGPGWAMLPSASGFIDPLHSAGIAHTLHGIERVAKMLEGGLPVAEGQLADYGRAVEREHRHLDRLIAGCYARLRADDTAGFFAFCKLYFVAAVVSEHHRRAGPGNRQRAFLLADDPEFVDRLENAQDSDAARIHALLRPIDPIGLCDPAVPNRVPFG